MARVFEQLTVDARAYVNALMNAAKSTDDLDAITQSYASRAKLSVSDLVNILEQLRLEKKRINDETAQEKALLDDLKRNYSSTEKEIAKIKKAMEGVADAKGLEQNILNLNKSLSSLRTQKSGLNDLRDALVSGLENADIQITSLTKKLDEYYDTVKRIGTPGAKVTQEEFDKASTYDASRDEQTLIKYQEAQKKGRLELVKVSEALDRVNVLYNRQSRELSQSKAAYDKVAATLRERAVLSSKQALLERELLKLGKEAEAQTIRLNAAKEEQNRKNILLETSTKNYGNELRMATKSQREQATVLSDMSKRLDIAIRKIVTYRLAFGAYRTLTTYLREVMDETYRFNSEMQDLRKVLDGTDEDFAKLSKEAFNLGITFGRSGSEVASTFGIFAQQGLKVNAILDRTVATLLLVSATTLDTSSAVEALTAVVENYPEYIDNATLAVSKWVAVQASAPVTAGDLANAMKGVGSTAAELGVTLDELNGIVASIAEVTRKSGREIGTSLKTLFARIPREETVNAFKKIGIAVRETQESYRPFGDILIDLRNKWDSLNGVQTAAITQQVGGVRRYNEFLALLKNFDRYVGATVISILAQNDAFTKSLPEIEKYKRQLQSAKTANDQLMVGFYGDYIIPKLITLSVFFAKLSNTVNLNKDAFGTLGKYILYTAVAFGSVLLVTKTYLAIAGAASLQTGVLGAAFKEMGWSAVGASAGVHALNIALSPYTLGLAIIIPLLAMFAIKSREAKEANKELEDQIRGHISVLDELQSLQSTVNQTMYDADTIKKLRELNARREAALKMIDALAKAEADEQKKREEATMVVPESFYWEPKTYTYKEMYPLVSGIASFFGKQSFGAKVEIIPTIRSKEGAIKAYQKYLDELGQQRLELKIQDIRATGGEKAVHDFLANEINETAKEMQKLIHKGSEEFFPKEITSFLESTYKIESSFKNMGLELSNLKGLAEQFGKSFDPVIEQYNLVASAAEEVKKLEADYTARTNEIRLLKESGLLKKTNYEDSVKWEKELQALLENQKELEAQIAHLNGIIADTAEEAVAAYQRRLEAQTKLTLAHERDSMLLKVESEQLGILGKGYQKLSSVRALDHTIMRQIIARNLQQVTLSHKLEESAINLKWSLKEQDGYQLSKTEIQEKTLDYAKLELKYASDWVKVNLDGISQINKMIENTQQAVVNAFATSFTALPGDIVSYHESVKEIERERIDAQKELRKAQAQGDQDAIISAKNSLIDLENRMRALKPVWVGIFSSVGDVAINKWAETFANSVINEKAAETLASGIIPASWDGARKYYEAIINGTLKALQATGSLKDLQVTSNQESMDISYINEAGETVSKKIPLAMVEGGDLAKSRLETAIESGGNLAAISLLKAFNIGTGQVSNALSNVGAMFGSALFKDSDKLSSLLGSFAGPVGTLLGGLFGATIGKLFEKDPIDNIDANTEAIRANTATIENTNKLLDLQRQFINAPANYVAPPAYGQMGGGGMNLTLVIQDSGNARQTAQEVINAIDAAYGNSTSRISNRIRRFGS
jgi:TP901 family phage tail tape measure protein